MPHDALPMLGRHCCLFLLVGAVSAVVVVERLGNPLCFGVASRSALLLLLLRFVVAVFLNSRSLPHSWSHLASMLVSEFAYIRRKLLWNSFIPCLLLSLADPVVECRYRWPHCNKLAVGVEGSPSILQRSL